VREKTRFAVCDRLLLLLMMMMMMAMISQDRLGISIGKAETKDTFLQDPGRGAAAWQVGDRDRRSENASFALPFMLNMIILPRRAWDKHREKLKKRCVFSCRAARLRQYNGHEL